MTDTTTKRNPTATPSCTLKPARGMSGWLSRLPACGVDGPGSGGCVVDLWPFDVVGLWRFITSVSLLWAKDAAMGSGSTRPLCFAAAQLTPRNTTFHPSSQAEGYTFLRLMVAVKVCNLLMLPSTTPTIRVIRPPPMRFLDGNPPVFLGERQPTKPAPTHPTPRRPLYGHPTRRFPMPNRTFHA